MAWQYITAGDYGYNAVLIVQQNKKPIDISGYTTREFVLKSPSGQEKSLAASFQTDGANGRLIRLIQDGDINVAGKWSVRARLTKTDAKLTSEWHEFDVAA